MFSAINGSQIEVKFSKAVVKSDVLSGTTLQNVAVALVGTGTATGTLTGDLSTDGKVLTISNSNAFDGKYSVTFTNNAISSKDNPSEKLSGSVEVIDVKDTIAPTVTGVEYGVTTATVKFSEPLASEGTVSLDGVALVSGTGYTALTAGDDELEITGLTPGKSYQLAIVGAKDIAGNYISPNPTILTLNLSEDKVKPSVAITSKDTTITLEFSEKIDPTKGNIVINGTTTALSGNITQVGTSNKYTYDASSAVTGSFLNATVKVTGYEDLAGNVGDDVTKTLLLTKDTTAPKYVSSTFKDDTITVKFDEKVKTNSLTTVDVKYTSKDNVVTTKTGAAVTATEVDQYGNSVTAGDDVYVALKVTEAGLLSGTKLKPGTYEVTIATGEITDAVTPANATTTPIKFTVTVTGEVDTKAIVEVDAANTKQVTATPGAIEVKYANSVDMGQSALDYRNYKLAGVTIPSTSDLYFDGAKDTVRINLPEGYVTVSGSRLLEVANVKDVDGNTLKANKTSASVNLLENVKPQATKVTLVDGQNLEVTFSEKINTLPGTVNGVTVKVNGVTQALDSTTPFALDATGKLLTIQADTATAFKLTDTITVEFKDTNILDMAGNAVKNVTLAK